MDGHAVLLDDLTRVPTRAYAEAVLQEALAKGEDVAVLFLDIDHFKTINDAFGHDAGDEALRFVAQRFREEVASLGIVARYGGDEFIIVLPGSGFQAAQEVAQRILDVFSERVVSQAYPFHLRLSIGVAVAPYDSDDAEVLVRIAERRHALSKRAGGHNVVAFDRNEDRAAISKPRRLVGRKEQLAQLQMHLDALERYASGVIRIQSPPLGGAEDLLKIAEAIAQLRGWMVLPVRPSPALRQRYLGAVSESVVEQFLKAGLEPPPLETPKAVLSALHLLEERWQGQRGAIVTVANAEWLDQGSVEALQALLNARASSAVVGIVYSTVGAPQVLFRAPMFVNISLPPLSAEEARAWLRNALRWEPPHDFIQWMLHHTEGMPGRMYQALKALQEEGFLQPVPEGWSWYPPTEWHLSDLATADLSATGVPMGLPLLIGRNGALRTLRAMLQHYPLITVVGPEGIGKSRLLQQLALESAQEGIFQGHVHYLDLGDGGNYALLASLAQRFGVVLRSPEEDAQKIAEALQHEVALLVLDDLESVDHLASLTSAIFRTAPQVRIVLGARHPLNLPLERVFRLGGLATESWGDERSPAEALFVNVAQRGGLCLGIDEVSNVIKEICRWTGGSPMGLRIAASWCASLKPEEILRQLGGTVDEGNPLHGVLETFWRSLSVDEQKRLARLSVFQGAFTAQAAAFVSNASRFFLDALVAEAYLTRTSDGLYHLSRSLKGFALTKAQAWADNIHEARRAHAVWYLRHLPATSGWHTQNYLWGLTVPALVLPDVLSAWRWALQQRDVDLLGSAAVWVFSSLGELNRFGEAYQLLDESLRTLRAYPPAARRKGGYFELRTHLELRTAEILFHLGDYERVLHLLHRARSRWFKFLAPSYRVYLLLTLGRAYHALGRYDKAREVLRQARRICLRMEQCPLTWRVVNSLGTVAYAQGDLEAAERYFRQALELVEERGEHRARAALLNNLANLAWRRGEYAEADDLLDVALQVMDAESVPSLHASVLDSLARLRLSQRRYDEALRILNQAIRLALRSHAVPNVLIAMASVVHVWKAMGHTTDAARLLATLSQQEALPRYDLEDLAALRGELPREKPYNVYGTEDLAKQVMMLNRRFIAAWMRR